MSQGIKIHRDDDHPRKKYKIIDEANFDEKKHKRYVDKAAKAEDTGEDDKGEKAPKAPKAPKAKGEKAAK